MLGCRCWVETEQLTVFGPTHDVGAGGLFIRTAAPFQHGTLVELTLSMPDEPDALRASAVVARAVPMHLRGIYGIHGIGGIGLEFVQIHRGAGLLQTLIKHAGPGLLGLGR